MAVRRYSLRRPVRSAPVVAGNAVFFGATDGTVYGVDTGRSLQHLYETGQTSRIVAAPALDRGYGCAWGDFNNDGQLDLLVSNQSVNYLYRNDGGIFTKIAFAGAVGALSWSGSWADYNLDGWLDLFIANGAGNNDALLLNNRDSTFTRITNPIIYFMRACIKEWCKECIRLR
jgi:hypothetical protein